MAMVYVLKEKGQEDAARVLRVIKEYSDVVWSPETRQTFGGKNPDSFMLVQKPGNEQRYKELCDILDRMPDLCIAQSLEESAPYEEFWPRITQGTPVEWVVQDVAGNARDAVEGLMDLWPRVTMGTVNENQSNEPVSHAVFAPWPRYTWGTGCPGDESVLVNSSKEERDKLLADFLDVWPRITWASTISAR